MRRLAHDPVASGIALTLASAVFMSGLGITTQLAYRAGANVGTLLSGRFMFAAALLWPLVWLTRARRPGRRQALAGLALGVGYSAHGWLFSHALARLDAGLVDLLLFTYPAFVMMATVALRRERWTPRRAMALACTAVGTVLVLVGGLHSIDPVGAGLAVGASVAYTGYILASAGQLERVDPLVLIALVTTGAGLTLTAAGVARHDVTLHVDAEALGAIASVGLVAVAGMGTFVAGIGRLGPARASIISAVQPALTPVLGFVVFADRLGPEQVLGGALVIGAVVVLEARAESSRLSRKFRWLPRVERQTLARAAEIIELPAGASLIREGALSDGFFLLERGRVRIRQADDDIGELGAGEFFGELALLSSRPRTASVIAATDVRVRVIAQPEFARTMRALPTF